MGSKFFKEIRHRYVTNNTREQGKCCMYLAATVLSGRPPQLFRLGGISVGNTVPEALATPR